MLCLSGFELYSRWMPLKDDESYVFLRRSASGVELNNQSVINKQQELKGTELEELIMNNWKKHPKNTE